MQLVLVTVSCRWFLFAGIRQLQLILLKVALLMGVEVHMGVEFKRLLEPLKKQRQPHRKDTSPSLACVISMEPTSAVRIWSVLLHCIVMQLPFKCTL